MALATIRQFLSSCYQKTRSDDLGSMLGELNLHIDGTTWDPAAGDEWYECCTKIARNTTTMTREEAFLAMKEYLGIYAKATRSKEIALLIDKFHIPKSINDNNEYWNQWLKYNPKKSIEVDCLLYKKCPFQQCF